MENCEWVVLTEFSVCYIFTISIMNCVYLCFFILFILINWSYICDVMMHLEGKLFQ